MFAVSLTDFDWPTSTDQQLQI